jgi:hypothetical protein
VSATKFTTKPFEITAMRFDGDNTDEITEFTGPHRFHTVDQEDHVDDPNIVAEVWDELHGTWVGVLKGQWIIKGIKGEFYPCDPEVFAAKYEPVTP